MSTELYLQALSCQDPDVVPHQIWLSHPAFVSDCTGVEYFLRPMDASLRFHRIYDVDNGGPAHWDNAPLPRPPSGRAPDGGVRSEESFRTVWRTRPPFSSPEELWNFDPDPWGKDCGKAMEPDYAVGNFRWCFQPETWDERRKSEEAAWERMERIYPGKFTDARSFYCTSFMWGICIFGWDVFLAALAENPGRTADMIRRVSGITERMWRYFAFCGNARFAVAHDDLCMTSGPVTDPRWYREHIYPEYERIFAPAREAGKKVIFLSDGDLTKVALDVAPLVDGFIFEPSTPNDFMFDHFGAGKCLIGGIDTRILTFGDADAVEKHVGEVISRGKRCPGYVVAAAATLPENVPLRNVYRYFETVEKYRRR